ncbi:MAG: YggS family pyridoxal phosphate-dependent enzyme [Clostridia bacterium]|nr:YggS family pyridoxal phosphate-dependent enzyme [Clostridia bacterium]
MVDFSYIEKNYLTLKEEVSIISQRLGTPPPTVIAVTKSATDEELLALSGYGATDIAENRPQELIRRAALLSEAGFAPRYHQIGHLQSNKAAKVLTISPIIHSLASESLLRELERVCALRGVKARVLIEVNSAKEAQKSGILPEEVLPFFEKALACTHIEILGLMTMGPVCENAEDIRPYFRRTKALLDTLNDRYGFPDTPILSMGMSDSWRVAVEEGSTHLRVGRHLFIRN